MKRSSLFGLKWNSILLFCYLTISFSVDSASAQVFSSGALNPDIDTLLGQVFHPYLAKRVSFSQQQALRSLYSSISRPLLWVHEEDSSGKAEEILKLLDSAQGHGLRADDYDVDTLKTKWRETLTKKNLSHYERALLDTALSLSTLRYLTDLRWGRDSEERNRFGFPRVIDYEIPVHLTVDAIKNGRIDHLPELAEPNFTSYRVLVEKLQYYRNLTRNYRFPAILFQESLREGDYDSQVSILRRKLIALGLLQTETTDNQDIRYQGKLIDAVKRFQQLHGLESDGIIGKQTLAMLNTPLLKRVRQLELGLERIRWLSGLNQDQGLILVNVPAFRLCAYDPGNVLNGCDLSMKVVVGIAKKNQTPIFMAELSYLEFRPYWNVPKSITVKELLPKIKENPTFLQQQDMELVRTFSDYAEPQPFNPESLELLRSGIMKIRQRPGPKNALGLVKFIFPNRYGVYLHDTPARKLFLYDRRDFSHGCIRVEQPYALAKYILKSRHEWYVERIEEAMRKGDNNQRIAVTEPITVLIFYSTVMVMGDEVYFFEDIYNLDEALSQTLYPKTDQNDLTSTGN